MSEITSVGRVKRVLKTLSNDGSHLCCIDRQFYFYNGKIWVEITKSRLSGLVLNVLSSYEGNSFQGRAAVRETVDLLEMACATDSNMLLTQDSKPIINVLNGELWIKDGLVQLQQHHSTSWLTHSLNASYDPCATCPLFEAALTEIFSRSCNPAAMVAFYYELLGYVLQPARPEARVIICWGAGSDGKSSLANLLVTLLGPEQVAALPIGSLAGSRFAMGHLAGKRLLLDDDVAANIVLPDGLLKTISERKVVTAERKFRDPVTFKVRALPMLLCNSVPRLRDTSNGFRRRLTVLPFNRQFSPSEADQSLFERIEATELPGVLNRALEGLQRVAQRGWKLVPPEDVVTATNQWWAAATDVRRSPASAGASIMTSSPQPHGSTLPKAEPAAPGNDSSSRRGLIIEIDGTERCAVTVRTPTSTVKVQLQGEVAPRS